MSDVESKVREYYDKFGWVKGDGGLGEDRLFRQFSPPYYPYHEKVIERTVACFSGLSGKLLMAGGGDIPESHIRIASAFARVTCLDISQRALDIAKQKLGNNIECILGSILAIPLPDDSFDAVFCAHVIYHVDKELQEKAVNELIRVTKPGRRVVVIYRNPNSMATRLLERKGRLPLVSRIQRRSNVSMSRPTVPTECSPSLYYAAHPLSWWQRFESKSRVSLIPWDVMGNEEEKQLFWFDAMAAFGYRLCSWLEKTQPRRAVKWWSYPLITFDKVEEHEGSGTCEKVQQLEV